VTADGSDRRPLAGQHVLEVGGSLPVAAAAKLFSDYGATVTKVEPRGGAPMRRLPPFPEDTPSVDTGAYHVALDTGKRSVVLDTSVASGREVLRRLISSADLVLAHLPPAEVEALRDSLQDDPSAPSIVLFGEHGLGGPLTGRLENDVSLFAWSGRMRQHSIPGEEPLRYAPHVPEMQWGATAAAAGAAALWARRAGGPRREIEVSGVEAITGNVDTWFLLWEFQGAEWPRSGGQSKIQYPAGCYACADGHVVFAAANQPFFGRLCEGIGRPELATDPRFLTPEQKALHFDEFSAILDPWLRARTKHEIFTALQAHGVMVAPVLDASEVAADPQAVERGSFVDHPLHDGGTTTIAGPYFHLDGGWQARPAPTVGQHTDEVLRELGYSAVERVALFRAGVTS
jgi:crotonobetainyl-CoA:carnitine CoA-transferase CaiB-like acyl-CoA transferase